MLTLIYIFEEVGLYFVTIPVPICLDTVSMPMSISFGARVHF